MRQGIAPTLLYPVPSPEEHPIVSKIIHSIRDYYPLCQVCLPIHDHFVCLDLLMSSKACLSNDGVLLPLRVIHRLTSHSISITPDACYHPVRCTRHTWN